MTETRRERLHIGFLLVASLATYLWTLAPGAMWGDSAKYVLAAHSWQLEMDGGYHPLYSLIATAFVKALPFFPTAIALNLLSALLGVASVLVLRSLIRGEGVRPAVATAGALAFAFSHAQWHLSVIAESYTLSLLGVLICARVARPLLVGANPTHSDLARPAPSLRRFLLLGVACGLVVSNFLLMIAYFGLLALLLAARTLRENGAPSRHAWGGGLALSLGFVIGTSLIWGPWLYYVGRGILEPQEATSLALNGRYATTFFWNDPSAAVRGLTLLGGLTLYQFPSPLLLFAIPGAIHLARRSGWWFLWTVGLVVGTYLFCSTYMIQRAVFVLLPVFAVWAFLAAIGLERVLTAMRKDRAVTRRLVVAAAAVAAVAPIPVYPMFLSGLALAEVDPVPGRSLPFRDNARYFLLPAKHGETGPRQLAEEVMALADGGCVLADFTPLTALEVTIEEAHARGRAPDVQLLSSEPIDAAGFCALVAEYVETERGLWFVDDEPQAYPIEHLAPDFTLEPIGALWRVVAVDAE